MKKAPSTLISSYKRRQQSGPIILWISIAVLIVVGLGFLIFWMTRPTSPVMSLFYSPTPTTTATPTATSTATATLTPTETTTPTVTMSPTAAEPFTYTVQEGDYLSTIAAKFNLGDDGVEKIMALPKNAYNETDKTGIDPATQAIFVGQVIWIPNPGFELPTATPIPADLKRGTEVLYTIRSGDYLDLIAAKFNSTVEDIKKTNNIETDTAIQAGQIIKVHVNLVTPTPTKNPTITLTPIGAATATLPSPYTPTPEGGVSPTPTLTPTTTAKP